MSTIELRLQLWSRRRFPPLDNGQVFRFKGQSRTFRTSSTTPKGLKVIIITWKEVSLDRFEPLFRIVLTNWFLDSPKQEFPIHLLCPFGWVCSDDKYMIRPQTTSDVFAQVLSEPRYQRVRHRTRQPGRLKKRIADRKKSVDYRERDWIASQKRDLK